jgi:hypothetical protein
VVALYCNESSALCAIGNIVGMAGHRLPFQI